jgi:hypothetical protein
LPAEGTRRQELQTFRGMQGSLCVCLSRKEWLIFIYLSEVLHGAHRSRDSVVDIATGYGLDDRGVGVRIPVGTRVFSSPRSPDRFWGSTQPPIQWLLGGVLSSGLMRPGREADISPPAGGEIKKIWIYTSTSPYEFMA